MTIYHYLIGLSLGMTIGLLCAVLVHVFFGS